MVALIGMLFVMYILVFGIIIFMNYLDFNDSNYQRASNHTFWQTFFDKGNMGEYNIYRTLEKIKGTKLILTNLYIPKEDGSTTEIDLVMITKYGFFVIESKNYRDGYLEMKNTVIGRRLFQTKRSSNFSTLFGKIKVTLKP